MSDYASALLQRQNTLLYRNILLAQGVSAVNAVLLSIVNLSSAGLGVTLSWTAVAIAVAAGRAVLGDRFERNASSHPPAFWLQASLLGAGLAGGVWAVGAFIFMRGAPEVLQFFTALVMAGMVAGAVPLLSAHRTVFRVYAWPMVVTVILVSFSEGGNFIHLAFGTLCILFLVAVSRSADSFQETLVEALRLEMDKARLADDLEEARVVAEQASHAKSNFLAIVSHELRTPLNGIIGMADVLEMTSLTPEQQEYVALVKTSGMSLQAIIGDIIEMTQIEAGRVKVDNQPFCLSDLLQAASTRWQSKAHKKNLAFSCDVAADVPAAVVGDERALRHIIDKLLDNAIKFTDAGEVALRVRVLSADASLLRLEFTVVDSGIGIPADKQASIFQPFGQADSSMTRRFSGTGLGLPISRRLAALLGGELTVNSEPRVGSTFRLTLPFSPV